MRLQSALAIPDRAVADSLLYRGFCTSQITLLYRILHTMHSLRTGLLAYENLFLE